MFLFFFHCGVFIYGFLDNVFISNCSLNSEVFCTEDFNFPGILILGSYPIILVNKRVSSTNLMNYELYWEQNNLISEDQKNKQIWE